MNGCSSEPSEVIDLIVGISETIAGTLSLYPNPVKTQVTFLNTQPIKGTLKVSLCSTNGIVIKEFEFKEGGNTFTINISDLAAGLYFLIFSGERIHSVRKLVIR